MSIVIRTQSGTAKSSTLRPDQPEEVLHVENFRVLSEVADQLGAWLLLDFADTLRELGADRAGVRCFRLVVDSSPERGPYRLVAEWENDLQMPHAPAETELGRLRELVDKFVGELSAANAAAAVLRAELAEVKRECDAGREALGIIAGWAYKFQVDSSPGEVLAFCKRVIALAEEEVSASDIAASEPDCGGGLCMAPTRCTACCAGCIGMGPCDDKLSSLDGQDDLAPDLEDFGCCALDDARGSGHEGPCAHICSHCNGSGECPACDGTGDDGSGLDYTCTECGGGSCPRCDEGMVTDD